MTSPSRDSEEGSGSGPPAEGRLFFAGLDLGGPLEELRRLFAKKAATLEGLGDRVAAERCARAFELAKSRLESALRRRPGPAGG